MEQSHGLLGIWTASNIANKKKTTLRCYWVYREPGHSEKKAENGYLYRTTRRGF